MNSKNSPLGIVNIDGGATFDLETKNMIFVPYETIPGMVGRFRKRGVGMQMSDGTFEFVPRKRERNTSILLRKLEHGSLTEGRDQKVRLSLVFDLNKESVLDIALAIAREALLASKEMSD